ncbi:MAG: ATP-binding protein [Rhizomicrobium sp.]
MSKFEPRALYLHTLDSLIADLVSGRSVVTTGGKLHVLPDNYTRSALQWYRSKGRDAWTANVSNAIGDEIVSAVLKEPPDVPALPARAANANSRRLSLRRVAAHRFAGLHKFGTPDAAPADYVHDLTQPLTLLEGKNGSGKTSLLNAIIWALTGELLRPQRMPESADTDFDCWVEGGGAEKERTAHRLSPITANAERQYVPAGSRVDSHRYMGRADVR